MGEAALHLLDSTEFNETKLLSEANQTVESVWLAQGIRIKNILVGYLLTPDQEKDIECTLL